MKKATIYRWRQVAQSKLCFGPTQAACVGSMLLCMCHKALHASASAAASTEAACHQMLIKAAALGQAADVPLLHQPTLDGAGAFLGGGWKGGQNGMCAGPGRVVELGCGVWM